MAGAASLERRLANFRAGLARIERPARPPDRAAPARRIAVELAARLAETLGGEVLRTPAGTLVRVERPSRPLPVDRDRLAGLPGRPPADASLVCLDTETTGLATAAGTVAFLVGLGWWEADRFRQVQLLLPDHPEEPALLSELARHLPADAWLVTYNGRGFDWPLLVARYRLARRDPPRLAGHLDLLPLARRLFRHRMTDARLRTVEASVLGLIRGRDVEGWEIPGRYLEFLRGGPIAPLVDVVRHNDEDVRALGFLVAHLEQAFGDPGALRCADPGDVAGLARALAGERRLEEALRCLDLALGIEAPDVAQTTFGRRTTTGATTPADEDDEWWLPSRHADFGGPLRRAGPFPPDRPPVPWSEERLLAERARLLRSLGRFDEAAAAWAAVAVGATRLAAVGAIELAKLREHRLGDPVGALEAVERAWAILDRRRRIGRPEPALERDLGRRAARLRRRIARRRLPGRAA